MKKLFFVISHGTEIRYLDALKSNYKNFDICLLVFDTIIDEIQTIIDTNEKIIVLPTISDSKGYKYATYFSALGDSLARRVNLEKNNIYPFSYSRKHQSNCYKQSFLKKTFINSLLPYIINPVMYIIKKLNSHLYQDKRYLSIFKKYSGSYLILFDHLGGNDPIAYNAKSAGLNVIYYLNNHKDLSIRPYAPLPSDTIYLWFDSQKKVIQNIVNTMHKVKISGLLRVQGYLKDLTTDKNHTDDFIYLLHCCSDPRRRPYEIYSINELCKQIKRQKLKVKLTLRINPMDNTNIFYMLKKFSFVTVTGSGWKWDPEKFVNLPSKQNEHFYFEQIHRADIVSSLPSTTLVESILFKKNTICFVDRNCPDFNDELQELSIVIPKNIIKDDNFKQFQRVGDYVEYLKGMQNDRSINSSKL